MPQIIGRTGIQGPPSGVLEVDFRIHGRFMRFTFGDEIVQQVIDLVLEDFIRLFPMHELRAATPRRTGRLRRSLRLRRDGSGVLVEGAFYGKWQPSLQIALRELSLETIRRLT